jgi:hypothetical protein
MVSALLATRVMMFSKVHVSSPHPTMLNLLILAAENGIGITLFVFNVLKDGYLIQTKIVSLLINPVILMTRLAHAHHASKDLFCPIINAYRETHFANHQITMEDAQVASLGMS